MTPGTKVHILTPITRKKTPGTFQVVERPSFKQLPDGLVWVKRLGGGECFVRVAKSRLKVAA